MTEKQIELAVHLAQDEATGMWFVARSDVPGLRVEGDCAEDILRKVREVSAELVALNMAEIVAAHGASVAVRASVRPIFDTPMALAS